MGVKEPESRVKLGKFAVIAVSTEDVKSQHGYGEDFAGSYGTFVINTSHRGSQSSS